MRNTKRPFLFAFLLTCAFCGPSFGQQRVFNWLPANDERVRLDPANYHTGRTYHPSANGGNIHVDIKAEKPITIFLTSAEGRNPLVIRVGAWSVEVDTSSAGDVYLRGRKSICL